MVNQLKTKREEYNAKYCNIQAFQQSALTLEDPSETGLQIAARCWGPLAVDKFD